RGEVLLRRQPAHGEEDRAQEAEACVAARTKQARVDAAWPAQHAPESARRQLVGERGGRGQRAAARIAGTAPPSPGTPPPDGPRIAAPECASAPQRNRRNGHESWW